MPYTNKLPFYTPALARERGAFSGNARKRAAGLLGDSTVRSMMRQGQLTLALIRPQVGGRANRLGLNDRKAAEEIESRFQGVGVAAKFSFRFDRPHLDQFYSGGPREHMLDVTPITDSKRQRFDNRWEELADLMLSGPTTALLLHAPKDAPGIVRGQFGHWNIEKNRDPQTIRGALGANNYNNLTHGSDTPQAVLRETQIIMHCLQNGRG